MNRQKDLNHARQKFLNIFLELTFCGVNGTQNEDEGEDQIGCFVAHLGDGRSHQGDRAAITFPKVKVTKVAPASPVTGASSRLGGPASTEE